MKVVSRENVTKRIRTVNRRLDPRICYFDDIVYRLRTF